MRAIESAIADLARTDLSVLLVGESGTGKEALALRIHELSGRSQEPFLKVSCATVTPQALTGLAQTPNGKGRKSGSPAGTLFLDEIGELDAACQPQLLQWLPNGDPVLPARCLGARVIAATRRNLDEEIHAGRFREDLYFRINGVCLRLPPLRHRKDDIPVLLASMLEEYARAFHRPRPVVSVGTLELLAGYAWPGNVRELENLAKKMVVLGEEAAALGDLAWGAKGPAATTPAGPGMGEGVSLKEAGRAALRRAERELILKTLARTRWNRKRAAEELQISYKALLYKLKSIGLDEAGS